MTQINFTLVVDKFKKEIENLILNDILKIFYCPSIESIRKSLYM
jgi:hypothetical protein